MHYLQKCYGNDYNTLVGKQKLYIIRIPLKNNPILYIYRSSSFLHNIFRIFIMENNDVNSNTKYIRIMSRYYNVYAAVIKKN